MISSLFSRMVIIFLGTLYPAYASYKAIRTKDVKEYVKWMMYWIVFALFITAEMITDVFLGFWFPFYYELKIVVFLWLLSPATEGSSILYRKFVHPTLVKNEQEIDGYLVRAREESVKTVMELGTKGFNYASRFIMETAVSGGGGLMDHLRRSYSVGDVSSVDSGRLRLTALAWNNAVDHSERRNLSVLRDVSVSDSDREEFSQPSQEFVTSARKSVRSIRLTEDAFDHPTRRLDPMETDTLIGNVAGDSGGEFVEPLPLGVAIRRRTGRSTARSSTRNATVDGGIDDHDGSRAKVKRAASEVIRSVL